jgi:hypothetical protein
MNASIIALISFGLIFGSAMIGMLVRRFLPSITCAMIPRTR